MKFQTSKYSEMIRLHSAFGDCVGIMGYGCDCKECKEIEEQENEANDPNP